MTSQGGAVVAPAAAAPVPPRPRRFTIRVPCTSSNIGPGFDVVGLSLSLYLTLTVTHDPRNPHDTDRVPCPLLTYDGLGASDAPLDPYKNLITRCALYLLRCHAHDHFPRGVRIHVHNQVPFGRGLGSSGAAVIAGVLLGDRLGRLNLSQSRLLDHALMVERHPDNVTAALVGGFVGSYLLDLEPQDAARKDVPLSEVLPEYPRDAGVEWGSQPPRPPHNIGHYIRFGWADEIRVIAVVPRFEVSTAKARDALPDSYSKADLVFNLQRLAVLTTALARSPPDPNLIFQAMQDRVHQPYRKELIPGLPRILASVTPQTHPSLLGICLSGAGPTILALSTGDDSQLRRIADTIVGEFAREGLECESVQFLDVTERGATVEEEEEEEHDDGGHGGANRVGDGLGESSAKVAQTGVTGTTTSAGGARKATSTGP